MTLLFPSPDLVSCASPALARLLGLPAVDQAARREHQILIADRPILSMAPGTIPVVIGGDEILVGPIWEPGAACHGCVRIRRDARRNQPAVTAELAAWYRTEAGLLFQGVNRGLIDEAISVARRAAAMQLVNRVWIFSFGTQRWHEERVVPVWSCERCGDTAPRGVEALVAELEGAP